MIVQFLIPKINHHQHAQNEVLYNSYIIIYSNGMFELNLEPITLKKKKILLMMITIVRNFLFWTISYWWVKFATEKI